MASPVAIVAYLVLFAGAGFLFLFANLLIGRFLRPADPHAEKVEVYECGEPAIGSSFVQFDLRFYVVALVFIVFDAEVAFMFPAATLFGKQTQLADPRLAIIDSSDAQNPRLTAAAAGILRETGVRPPKITRTDATMVESDLRRSAREFSWYTLWAIMVFFVVLFVGFAYEWKTGAFDWVRAVARDRQRPPPEPLRVAPLEEEPARS